MRKIIFKMLILVICSLSMIEFASAAENDVIYEVTGLVATANQLIFKGWAFGHLRDNFYSNTRHSHRSGLRIYIDAYDENGTFIASYSNSLNAAYEYIYNDLGKTDGLDNTTLDDNIGTLKTKTGISSGSELKTLIKYNFWVPQYSYSYGNDINADYFQNSDNKYYSDIGFYIKIDTNIFATPTTFKIRLHYTNSTVAGLSTISDDIYVLDSVISGVNAPSLTNVATGKVNATVKDGVYFVKSNDGTYTGNLVCSNSMSGCTGSKVFNVFTNDTSAYYKVSKNGNNSTLQTSFTKGRSSNVGGKIESGSNKVHYVGPGFYIICANVSSGYIVGQPSCTTSNMYTIYRSWARPYSVDPIKYIPDDRKCSYAEPASDKTMQCNAWKELKSTCNELTVYDSYTNTTARIKLEQQGYISNIFKGALVDDDLLEEIYGHSTYMTYNGGWFKYGIMYYNEVSWDYLDGKTNRTLIENTMNDRVLSLDDFQNNLNLTINGLEGTKLVKKCYSDGNFGHDGSYRTLCIFYLPGHVIEDDVISYLEDENSIGINNRYFVTLTEDDHAVNVTLENLSVLDAGKARADTVNAASSNPWYGVWNISTSCALDVTDRFGDKTVSHISDQNSFIYKFMYRPINLKNPFPNRNPGVNWYDWYVLKGNRFSIPGEDANLDYEMEIDNDVLTRIQSYNREAETKSYLEIDDEEIERFFERFGGLS